MTIRELTLISLKRGFYRKDGRLRRLSCVCRKCSWFRVINTVFLCGRRQHWEELKNDDNLDACCAYCVDKLPPLSILSDRSIVYLDTIIEELKKYGKRDNY